LRVVKLRRKEKAPNLNSDWEHEQHWYACRKNGAQYSGISISFTSADCTEVYAGKAIEHIGNPFHLWAKSINKFQAMRSNILSHGNFTIFAEISGFQKLRLC
jgi:hypothetical protein